MQYELRPITRDELTAFTATDLTAFGEKVPPDPRRLELEWSGLQLDRTLAAFDGDEMVGTGRALSFELTLPGGRLLPAGAVTWVAVLPTHRRQGILTAIKGRLLEDAVERGEPLAMLYASEGGIYRRFGYGMASSSMSVRLRRDHSAFLRPVSEAGRIRLVDESVARKAFPEVFDRARRLQPGAVQRVDAWWDDQLFWSDPERKGVPFFALYESASGAVDGYALYGYEQHWQDLPSGILHVHDLVTVTDAARVKLWRYLCDVDLVETVTASAVPVDDPLRWLLAESRRLEVSRLSESLWVRLLDVPVALASRTYATEGRLIFEVIDGFRPGEHAAGRFELEGGPGGATARRIATEPDLVIEVADLGAGYLGGARFSTLARAGLVEERTPGALLRADAMFASEPQPFGMTWF